MLFSRRYSTWQLVNHSQLLLVLRNCGPFSLMVPARHNGSPSHITQRQCISNGNILKKNTTDSTISITHRRISCNAGRDRDIKVPNASLACYLFSTVKQMGSVGSTFSYCRGFHSSTVGMNTQGPELGKVSHVTTAVDHIVCHIYEAKLVLMLNIMLNLPTCKV